MKGKEKISDWSFQGHTSPHNAIFFHLTFILAFFSMLLQIHPQEEISDRDRFYNYVEKEFMDIMSKPAHTTSRKRGGVPLRITSTNDIKIIMEFLFWVYKNFVSTQDISRCSFTPSCSEYMRDAILIQGPVFGFLNGLDRLMRCNGLSPEKYIMDTEKMRLWDPVHNDPLCKKCKKVKVSGLTYQ